MPSPCRFALPFAVAVLACGAPPAQAVTQEVFSESFDAATRPALPANWTTSGPQPSDDWVTTTSGPNSAPNAANIAQPTDIPAWFQLDSPAMDLTGCTAIVVSFRNKYNFSGFTASQLRFVASGNVGQVSTGFTSGGYNGTGGASTSATLAGTSNTWINSSGGYVTSTVNIASDMSLFPDRTSVKLRFVFGSDKSTPSAGTGWSIDDLSVMCDSTSKLSENFDGVTAPALPTGWSTSTAVAPRFDTSNARFDGAGGLGAAADEPAYAYDVNMTTPSISLASCLTGTAPRLSFRHDFQLTAFGANGLSGGLLELSVDGGPFQEVKAAGGTLASGLDYNGTFFDDGGGSGPFAGTTPVWTNTSGGFQSTAFDLPMSTIGQAVRLRWRMGTQDDWGTGGFWAVDNVSVTCGAPPISIAPVGFDFGNQLVGAQSASQSFVVTNNDTAAQTVGVATTGDYNIDSTTCGAPVAPTQSCTADVSFTPAATGLRSGSVVATYSSPGGNVSAPLTGVGIAPIVDVVPTTKDFGNQRVGTQSAATTFTVTNDGDAALAIASVNLTGTDPGEFTTSADTCTAASVAAGDSCTVAGKFAPTSTGAKIANLRILSNAPTSPTDVELTGTGVQPAIGVAPASKAFGAQQVGTSSAVQTFTVTNTGTDTLNVATAALTGTDAGQFALSSNTCDGQALAPTATCTVGGAFAPTSTGAKAATLSITGDATPGGVALTGEGTPVPEPPVTPGGPGSIPRLPLTLTGLYADPKDFAPANPGMAIFVLSRAARVDLHVDRVLEGRTRGGRCVVAGAARKRGARCVRFDDLGKTSVNGVAGLNSVPMPTTIGGTALTAGRYRLRARAADGTDITPFSEVRFRLT